MRTKMMLISLIFLLILAACNAVPTEVELPDGEADRGETLFTESIKGAPPCSSCHHVSTESLVGPGLAGVAERAASRVEGQSAAVYIYLSMVQPADHIVSGYTNLMYSEYRSRLSEQDLADLLAYLLTL